MLAKILTGTVILLAMLADAAPARAQEAAAMSDEARAHYERGLALYADKDYAGAIRELEAGYALEPRREFLFAEAQAQRLNGDCKSAVPLYKKFLDSEPDDVRVNAAHIALARCAEQMANTPTGAPNNAPNNAPTAAPAGTTPPVAVVPMVPAVPRQPAPAAPWYHDVAGGALLGAGVVGLALGTGFTLAALSARDDANESSPTYADYSQHWTTARSRSHVALAAFASGAAFTGAAIYRYLRVRRERAGGRAHSGLEAWVVPAALAGDGGGRAGPGGGAGFVGGVGGRF